MPKPQSIASRNETMEPTTSPDRTEIEVLAYKLWLDRGSPAGSPEEDWYRAENELSRGHSQTRAA
jgi:hypothetical protein